MNKAVSQWQKIALIYAANANVLAQEPGQGPLATIDQYNGTNWPVVGDFGAASIAVDAAGYLYALERSGRIVAPGALGWVPIDTSKATKSITAGGNPAGWAVYQQRTDHSIWQFTFQCGSSCIWQEIDHHATSGMTVAGFNTVHQIRKNPTSIWEYNGTPCSGTVCPGWVKLDDNPAITSIVAGPAQF